ncbi:hypothetical protein KUTeg_010270 [Tegillarca granosa]|uniref:Uncharacterized protein n=1 Tax=Tegillarca granosa TaxID=220873 RepID=A0ABQ9FAP0_TEGGR|nr:hypothetical protein KUTeg_010270 [Tegillarca granosa]
MMFQLSAHFYSNTEDAGRKFVLRFLYTFISKMKIFKNYETIQNYKNGCHITVFKFEHVD